MNQVVSPKHYTQRSFQPREVMQFMNSYIGSAFKYVFRHKDKGGKVDLDKAIQFLQFQLEDSPSFRAMSYDDFDKCCKKINDDASLSDDEKEILCGLVFITYERHTGKGILGRAALLRAINLIKAMKVKVYAENGC